MRSSLFSSALLLLLLASLPAGARPSSVLLLGSPSLPVQQALRRALQERGGIELVLPLPLGPAAAGGDSAELRTARRVEEALDQARRLFYEVRPEEAIATLEQQLRGSGTDLVLARRFDLLGALQLWRGVCELKRGGRAAARAAFAAAITLGQEAPDESRFGPAVAEAYASARGELKAAPRAALSIEVAPSSARAWLDGRPLRPAAPLPAGEHWLLVEAPGFVSTARALRLEPGAAQRLQLTLYPADRGLLRRQLQALAGRGELDPTSPSVALALCRWREASEVLLAREAQGALDLTRIECTQGQVLGRARQSITTGQTEAAAARAIGELWPIERAAPRSAARPFYKRWWFWTLVGGAVVAATTVGVVVGTRGPGTYTLRPE